MQQQTGRPIRAPRFFSPAAFAGWTLVEITIVLVVAAIFAYFVVVRFYAPKEALALQQAEKLRDDLRHAQMVAMSWNRTLRITVTPAAGPTPARYAVSCAPGGVSPPCNGVATVVDPATARPFQVDLEPGLDLTGPGFTLDFDPLGRPKNGAALAANANFDVTGGGVLRRVTVTQLTGFVTSP